MASKKQNNGSTVATTYEFNFPQPREKLSCGQMIYNSKDGTVLGRTPLSWAKILIFYAIFYAVLAGLFAICMQILFGTLSETEPKFKLGSSLIGTNPGLGYRPLADETERGAVIQFDTKKPEEGQFWKGLLDEFLEPYIDHTKLPNGGKNQKFCDFNTTIPSNYVCAVSIENFGPCSNKESYGYNKGKPCVFLKLNKIFGWDPQYYDDVTDLPEEMPNDLKLHIASLPTSERKQIWVSCKGMHKVDQENLGPMEYIPSRGFASFYYPYHNIPGYLSPLIAVRFEKPPIHQLVSVECRAWAKNIIYSGSLRDRKGSVAFQLFVD